MQVLIDRFITLLKWPLALYMLISIPAYIRSLYYFNFVNIKFIVLGAGFILFFIARQMADASVKTSMQIVAHELTHAFFALLTFHKVKHIRVEADDSGGSMGFEGEGNWLIIIAPYFFPLFGFFYMLFISVWTSFAPMNLILNGILGYFLGYHMDTGLRRFMKSRLTCRKCLIGFAGCFCPAPIFGLSAACWLSTAGVGTVSGIIRPLSRT